MLSVAKQNPELIARLNAAQNAFDRPVDILTFGYLATTREELERHVTYYEEKVAAQSKPRKRKARN